MVGTRTEDFFCYILDQLIDSLSQPSIQWEHLPDYLEHQKDDQLMDYLMRCNPYVGQEEPLLEEKSWCVELKGRVYYLFWRKDGYQLGLRTEKGILSLAPPVEAVKKRMWMLETLLCIGIGSHEKQSDQLDNAAAVDTDEDEEREVAAEAQAFF